MVCFSGCVRKKSGFEFENVEGEFEEDRKWRVNGRLGFTGL